jgi:hypothetical protein
MQSAPKWPPNLPNFAQDQILVKMMQEGRNRGRRCRLESVLDILALTSVPDGCGAAAAAASLEPHHGSTLRLQYLEKIR